MRIVFVGPPGSDKGTQADQLVAKYCMAHLSTDELLRQACDAKTCLGLKTQLCKVGK